MTKFNYTCQRAPHRRPTPQHPHPPTAASCNCIFIDERDQFARERACTFAISQIAFCATRVISLFRGQILWVTPAETLISMPLRKLGKFYEKSFLDFQLAFA